MDVKARRFFQWRRLRVGSRIRYGGPDSPAVEIFIVSRGMMYAWGLEEKTERRIFLFLRDGLLVDGERGSFGIIELLSE